MEEEESHPVEVYVYDLSQGLAPHLSQQILGVHLEAIYHTSVVVFGKEYYIDQGIKTNSPGRTKYGRPMKVLKYGETFIDETIFNDFLDELNTREDLKYSAVSYDLFDNNCNHFTDVCLDFLVGKNLEDKILKLPETVLNTPNGQMLKQMLGRNQLY